MDIPQQRLYNQHLSRHPLDEPAAVVAWLGAVQAQDYLAAKWGLGQRVRGATDATIEAAFTNGAILRTHVLRPTWHFVTPADIRWLLALTAPRVHTASTSMYRRLELDAATLRQGDAVLAAALQGGRQLTRPELVAALRQAGIEADDSLRFIYLVMHAELEGIICSGPRRGNQFTYALLEERVPPAPVLAREEALAELARRYFQSHGPATVADFVWWSGLTIADARAGITLLAGELRQEVVDGQTYWLAAASPLVETDGGTAYLLPNYDEYVVGYTNRSAIFDASHGPALDSRGSILGYTLVIEGRIVGTWKRTIKKDRVELAANPLVPLTPAETQAYTAAAERYGRFLGLPVML